MSIVTEDGTGLSSAETLLSVADCDTYHLRRGNTAWAGYSVPEKEAALRRTNDYLRQKYRIRWQGVKVKTDQGCEWPRVGVVIEGFYVDSDSVPVAVKDAVADLALRAIVAGSVLNPDLGQKVKREKVGPLETEYIDYARAETQLTAIEDALLPYLSGSRHGVPLVRR